MIFGILSSYFFVAPTQLDEKASKKAWKEDTNEILEKLVEIISSVDPYTTENLQNEIKGWITSNEIGFGKVMQPLKIGFSRLFTRSRCV